MNLLNKSDFEKDLTIFKDKFTIVVSSSDKYFPLLDGFIFFLEKNFISNPFKTIFVLEEKKLLRKEYESINNKKSEWSENLCNVLYRVESEFIILMLEDYWIEKKVDYENLFRILGFAIEYDVNHLTLIWKDPENYYHTLTNVSTSGDDLEFYRVDYNGKNYDYLLGASFIFKREFLINILRKNETAWEFETNASYRFSRRINEKNYRFFCKQGNPLGWRFSGVVEKGIISNSGEELINKFNLNINWNNQIVNVSTTSTPLFIRFKRKLFRGLKRVMSLYSRGC